MKRGFFVIAILHFVWSFLWDGLWSHEISVLSFNMKHRDRPEELKVMAQALVDEFGRAPDYILCQEVWFQRKNGPENTAAVLAEELGYWTRGTKRRGDREGTAILSRYPFQFYDSLEFRAQTNPLLLGFRRNAIMGEFTHDGLGRVRVVTTHLTNWGFEAHIRRKQVQELLTWIEKRQQQSPATATILGGDFNATPESEEIQMIQDAQRTGLRFLNFNDSQSFTMSVSNPTKRIDYIFISESNLPIQFIEERIVWREGIQNPENSKVLFLSDHLFPFHRYQLNE